MVERGRSRWVLMIVGALMAASCSKATTAPPTSSAPPTTAAATTTTAVPTGDDFYTPPEPLPAGAPGELIRSRPLTAPEGFNAWLVLYHSKSVSGKDIAVSGSVVAPDKAAPAGGWPIVAYAHGTTGVADSCTPSKSQNALATLTRVAQPGFVVAATDYEGLGTPGLHPYLVGESEGRSTLDGARAARRLPDAHAGDVVIPWGHSQGGHASLFAGQIAPTWAPELKLAGVVAGAPAADVRVLMTGAAGSAASFGFFASVAYSWSEVYPEARLDLLFPPNVIQDMAVVDRQCIGSVIQAFSGRPLAELVKARPSDVQPWATLLQQNSAGATKIPAPVLVVQGDKDELVPYQLTQILVQQMCAKGGPIDFKLYPGETHVGSARASFDEVLTWMADRVKGTPAPSTCAA